MEKAKVAVFRPGKNRSSETTNRATDGGREPMAFKFRIFRAKSTSRNLRSPSGPT